MEGQRRETAPSGVAGPTPMSEHGPAPHASLWNTGLEKAALGKKGTCSKAGVMPAKEN